MNENELRIGNLVKYMDEHLPVLAIDSEKEFKEYDLIGVVTLPTFWNGRRMSCQGRWMNQVEPIELTEEWLLKFGFEAENGYPFKMLFGYIKIRNGKWFFKYYSFDIELLYVHQLQNLYFALTREELQIP